MNPNSKGMAQLFNIFNANKKYKAFVSPEFFCICFVQLIDRQIDRKKCDIPFYLTSGSHFGIRLSQVDCKN